MADNLKYPGNELELFSKALNWKKYLHTQIAPFLNGKVLEVGAGIGGSMGLLSSPNIQSRTLVEPDKELFQSLIIKNQNGELPPGTTILLGTIDCIREDDKYDSIIYIDVLEHIEKDTEELIKAEARLNIGGRLIVLSPAFQNLYSPFDKAIGHYRRYDRKMLKAITPTSLDIVQMKYLDSIGYFASLANRILLKQTVPTEKQVRFWDKVIVPASKAFDRLFFYSFGKSILAIWKKL